LGLAAALLAQWLVWSVWKTVENELIGSFNGRLRDKYLNLHLFWSIKDPWMKLEIWREDYAERTMTTPTKSRTATG
jgi:hypothetical protein